MNKKTWHVIKELALRRIWMDGRTGKLMYGYSLLAKLDRETLEPLSQLIQDWLEVKEDFMDGMGSWSMDYGGEPEPGTASWFFHTAARTKEVGMTG